MTGKGRERKNVKNSRKNMQAQKNNTCNSIITFNSISNRNESNKN